MHRASPGDPTVVSPVDAPGHDAAGRIHPTLIRRFAEVGDAQRVKAWVLFTDKGFASAKASQAAAAALGSAYNLRAIERRRQRRALPGLFDVHDLPVPARYLDGVAATGVTQHVISKWVNGVSAWGTWEQFERVGRLPYVKTIQPVRRGRKVDPAEIVGAPEIQRSPAGPTSAGGGSFYGESEAQLTQMNLIPVHDLGFTGSGVVIGVLDTGFERSHIAFNEPGHPVNVIAEYDFIDDDADTSIEPGDPYSQHAHGTWILGTLGAYRPGELVGAAYNASFILCKTEDTTGEYPAEEDNYVAGLEFIEANGGDVATSSLAYIDWYTQQDLDGLTAVTTVAVNIATSNGVYCCTAAGNDGHDADPTRSHLLAPADAFEVLSCGAVDSGGAIASFSSDGPTADGRVKPEILARGVNTRTVNAYDETGYSGVGGTSLSTPLVAGAVACLAQAHPEWTVQQMRERLFRTASDYVATGTFDPAYVRGYGVIDALSALTLSAAACCRPGGACEYLTLEDCLTAGGTPQRAEAACLGDSNGNGLDDLCEACGPLDAPEAPLAASHAANESARSLSFVPTNAGRYTALRVRLTASADFPGAVGSWWWLGSPQEVCENPGQGLDTAPEHCGSAPGIPKATLLLSRLQCSQHCRDWGSLGDVVHVVDRHIVPSATYEIQAIECGCDPENPADYSPPMPVTTAMWGDVVEDCTVIPCSPPDGRIDVPTDVVSVLDKFASLPGAPLKIRVDMEPEIPDLKINITDVLESINAFGGDEYPFAGPVSCP